VSGDVRKPSMAFTGHRPQKLGGYGDSPTKTRIKAAVQAAISKFSLANPGASFISGMALGLDQWAAEIVLELGLPLIAAVPCKGQERMWPHPSKQTYRDLIARATEVVVLAEHYSPVVMQIRNRWMVDRATDVLAVWDGSSGGTENCVRYALTASHGPNIIIIDPVVTELEKA